jgi:hypothetical protein
MADGLAGVEVEGVVGEEGGFDAGDVEGVDAVAEGEAWGEAVVKAFLGFDGGFAVEGEVNMACERFEKAFFIDDAGLEDGGVELGAQCGEHRGGAFREGGGCVHRGVSLAVPADAVRDAESLLLKVDDDGTGTGLYAECSETNHLYTWAGPVCAD